MSAIKPEGIIEIIEQLDELRDNLFFLAIQNNNLSSLVEELEKVTLGNEFRVNSPFLWQMFIDSHQKLIIDLVSFSKSLQKFLDSVKGNLLFFKTKTKTELSIIYNDPFLEEMEFKYAKNVLKKCFNVKSGKNISVHCINELKENLRKSSAKLIQARDQHYAHRFESKKNDSQPSYWSCPTKTDSLASHV